jgi:hypothetical protein
VPVTIRNSREIQPPGRFGIRSGRIELFFHPPIATEHLELADRNQVLEMTREAIARNLE